MTSEIFSYILHIKRFQLFACIVCKEIKISDYVDYDSDVTIPPNLTDLLANLQPQDINADNLQKVIIVHL